MSETNGTMPPVVEVEDTPIADVRENCLCLNVNFHTLGNRRQGDLSLVQTDADKTALSMSKELVDSPELRELINIRTTIRRALATQALRAEHLKTGLWLIPVRHIDAVDAMMLGYTVLWDAGVQRVIDQYPAHCAAAPERLKSQYRASDYLNTETDGWEAQIREQCTFDWSWVEMRTPGRLQRVAQGIFQREQQKAEETWQEASAMARQIIRQEAAQWISGLQGRLAGDTRLTQRYLEKFSAWISTFTNGRNVTNDAQLHALMQQAQTLLADQDAQAMRTDDALRTHAAQTLQQLGAQVDALVAQAPTRRFVRVREDAPVGEPVTL